MKTTTQKRLQVKTLVLGAILTALVIVLQMLGSFIHLGPFSISLVLIPIVIGAATCGPWIGAWLGLVFSVVVLMTDAAAFFAVSVPGTIVTVLAKGILAGLAAGCVYKLLEKKNKYLAVAVAAIVCPVVNTGIFIAGSYIFFLDAVTSWGVAGGFANATAYIFLGMVGGNFLFELATNIILSPVIVRLLNISKKSF